MRQHLNTLFVTTEGAWLRKDGANIVVEVEQAEIGRGRGLKRESMLRNIDRPPSPPVRGRGLK